MKKSDTQKLEQKYRKKAIKLIQPTLDPNKALNLWRNEARMFDPNIGYNVFIDYDTADSSILKDIQFQRVLSEELAANHPAYTALIKSLVTATTLDGFGFSMDVPGQDKLNEETKKHFKRWSKCVSADSVGSFNDIANMIAFNYYLYGEAFGLIVSENDDKYQIRFRGVSTVRVENPTYMPDESKFKCGIEQTTFGKPKYLYIRKDQSGEGGHWKKPFFDVEGNRLILHTFRKNFFDQSHGSVGSSPIYRMLNDLSLFMANEVRASSNASAINILMKRQNPGAVVGGLPTMNTGTIANPNTVESVPIMPIDAGTTLMIRPGDEVEQFELKRPIPEYQNFLDANLRIICQAFGFSYEYVFCRWADSNNASAKIAALHTQKALRIVQNHIVESALEPLVKTWLRALVRNGIVDLGDVDEEDYLHSFKIIKPQFPLLDPQKEIAAMAAAVDANFISLTEATEKLGFGDASVNIRQRGRELKEMKEAGIPMPDTANADGPTGENLTPGQVGKPPGDGSSRSLSRSKKAAKIKVVNQSAETE